MTVMIAMTRKMVIIMSGFRALEGLRSYVIANRRNSYVHEVPKVPQVSVQESQPVFRDFKKGMGSGQ
jgi:hypothetical protein